jgi:hypothetical protein
MSIRIQIRRGLASEWTSANPTLLVAELALETDTRKFKIGDGVTAWTSLPYATQGEAGQDGADGQNGLSLEFNWSGTSLGVRQEGSDSYQYVDLKGEQGESVTVNLIEPVAGNITITASDVGAVPTTRRVNNIALTGDVTVKASDTPYNNAISGLAATTVQQAIDRLLELINDMPVPSGDEDYGLITTASASSDDFGLVTAPPLSSDDYGAM